MSLDNLNIFRKGDFMGLLKKIVVVTTAISASVLAVSVYFFQFTVLRKKDDGEGPENVGTNWEKHIPFIRQRREWLDKQPKEPLSITSCDGLKLSAIFVPNEKPSNKVVIAVHGYKSKGINDYSAIAPFYLSKGYNMLIVDNRAHGKSEGKFIGFGCLDKKDCIEWINYIDKRFNGDCSIVLHGTSMGASTIMMASGQSLPKSVKCIISDCGFSSAWDVFKYILKRDYHLPAFPIMHITSFINKIVAGYSFRECSAIEEVRKTKLPILFIHGEKDDFVPTQMGIDEYEACASEKSLLIVKGADHAESYYADTQAYEEAVNKFLKRYCD